MISRESYDKIISEYFDITDRETRKVLLNVNEADQNQILSALTSKLYDHIVDKVDDIDFGTIPNTQGDISKLENYNELVDCINVMRDLLKNFKQDTKSVDIINEALANIESRKSMFEKAFKLNIEMPMVMYSLMTLSIISSTSFLISTCVEFIKDPAHDNFEIVFDKVGLAKSKNNLLFNNLSKFNTACNNGQFDKSMESVIGANVKKLTGVDDAAAIAAGVAIVTVTLSIVPIMRELIYFFYRSRVRVSDYFDIQADLLQMNAYNMQSLDTTDKEEVERIVNKQLKIVEIFRNIANKLAINNKKCEVTAKGDMQSDNRKYKTNELLDTIPDSASSALF